MNKKKNSDIQKSKQDKKQKDKKKDVNTSMNLALKKLALESKKLHGIVDQTSKKAPENTISEKKIKSADTLRKNCNKLLNHLHQRMQHSIALKVSELSQLITDDLNQRAMQKIVDAMDDISRKHGFDFYK